MDEKKERSKEEIFSKRVKAGKRTYFFDVKSTRSNDYYLTITESKRKYKDDNCFYEKHKVFLYKEDFSKFLEALEDTVEFVKKELASGGGSEDLDSTIDDSDDTEDFSWS